MKAHETFTIFSITTGGRTDHLRGRLTRCPGWMEWITNRVGNKCLIRVSIHSLPIRFLLIKCSTQVQVAATAAPEVLVTSTIDTSTSTTTTTAPSIPPSNYILNNGGSCESSAEPTEFWKAFRGRTTEKKKKKVRWEDEEGVGVAINTATTLAWWMMGERQVDGWGWLMVIYLNRRSIVGFV